MGAAIVTNGLIILILQVIFIILDLNLQHFSEKYTLNTTNLILIHIAQVVTKMDY